jgi:hypothetical protein
MIIGNGLISKALTELKESENVLIFASGVSNSREVDQHKFVRELSLLKIHYDFKGLFVYFSTCSIDDPAEFGTPYTEHKKNIENLLLKRKYDTLIIRLPIVAGKGGNNNNLINFLMEKLKNNEIIEVWSKARRNIIDIEDVKTCIQILIKEKKYWNKINTIATPFNWKVDEIVILLARLMNKKPKYKNLEKGAKYFPKSKIYSAIMNKYKNMEKNKYFENIFSKYYE